LNRLKDPLAFAGFLTRFSPLVLLFPDSPTQGGLFCFKPFTVSPMHSFRPGGPGRLFISAHPLHPFLSAPFSCLCNPPPKKTKKTKKPTTPPTKTLASSQRGGAIFSIIAFSVYPDASSALFFSGAPRFPPFASSFFSICPPTSRLSSFFGQSATTVTCLAFVKIRSMLGYWAATSPPPNGIR